MPGYYDDDNAPEHHVSDGRMPKQSFAVYFDEDHGSSKGTRTVWLKGLYHSFSCNWDTNARAAHSPQPGVQLLAEFITEKSIWNAQNDWRTTSLTKYESSSLPQAMDLSSQNLTTYTQD